MARTLVKLRDRYKVSRATIWRMKTKPGFPTPVLNELYYEDELEAYEAANRKVVSADSREESESLAQ